MKTPVIYPTFGIALKYLNALKMHVPNRVLMVRYPCGYILFKPKYAAIGSGSINTDTDMMQHRVLVPTGIYTAPGSTSESNFIKSEN